MQPFQFLFLAVHQFQYLFTLIIHYKLLAANKPIDGLWGWAQFAHASLFLFHLLFFAIGGVGEEGCPSFQYFIISLRCLIIFIFNILSHHSSLRSCRILFSLITISIIFFSYGSLLDIEFTDWSWGGVFISHGRLNRNHLTLPLK